MKQQSEWPERRYSRYPVFENDTDNIIGILHLKDVMRLIVSGETDTDIKDVMRKPVLFRIPRTSIHFFREMQAKKVHMAIVVDEYGQSCGLVAMEDILEEIVGNILDEYDPDEDNIQIIGGAYLMKGLTPLEDITRVLGIPFGDDFENPEQAAHFQTGTYSPEQRICQCGYRRLHLQGHERQGQCHQPCQGYQNYGLILPATNDRINRLILLVRDRRCNYVRTFEICEY